jgi:hypothetical protein
MIHSRYSSILKSTTWTVRRTLNARSIINSPPDASFNGIVAGGSSDTSVKTEDQYKQFEEFMQRLVSIQGGDQRLAGSPGTNPTQFDVYKNGTIATSLVREL